jgi:hypothetical protein
MWPVLSKLFVRAFYRANAGFFLFFFFVFFGAIEGGQLLPYHLSLMKSILQSGIVLSVVFVAWLLYHLKCTGFFLRVFNSAEGSFLYRLQTLSPVRQWFVFLLLYMMVYAPVLVYGIVLCVVGWQSGYPVTALSVLLFQLATTAFFTGIIIYWINHWLIYFSLPGFRLPFQKKMSLLVLYYFSHERKTALLVLKGFSLLLLYLILVWNRGRYDNDSFLLFYLVVFLAHAALPWFAVQFLERSFSAYRNLPVSLAGRGAIFLLPYVILVLPEAVYIFTFGDALPVAHRLAYSINLPVSLALLTAFQYSEASGRNEYLKAVFALMFISLFVLHVQAFWWLIVMQLMMAAILFSAGYYRYEKQEE